jgi:cytochrome b
LSSNYAIKVFGFATFGRIYGTIVSLSGLFNFAQPGLDALTHGPLGNNPTPLNMFLAITSTILAASLTGFVGTKSRELRDGQLQQHEESERTGLIREEVEEYGTTL